MTANSSYAGVAQDNESYPATLPRMFDQAGAAKFLWDEYGVRIASKTLQKRRVTGQNSPPFRKVIGRILYEEGPLRSWAEAQRSPLVNSTSELSINAT